MTKPQVRNTLENHAKFIYSYYGDVRARTIKVCGHSTRITDIWPVMTYHLTYREYVSLTFYKPLNSKI